MRERFRAFVFVLFAAGCGSEPEGEEAPRAIPPGAFATVGESVVALDLLGSVPASERMDRARLIVRDELFRKEAVRVGKRRGQVVERAVLSRKLIETIEAGEALERSVSDEELRAQYEKNWLEFDRPRAVRTVHIFFPVGLLAPDQAQYERARQLRDALEGVHNLTEFGRVFEKVIGKDENVRVLELPPVSADGRVVRILPTDREVTGMSADMVRSIAALESAGDMSDVVGSEQGFHISFATEVIPSEKVSFAGVRGELERRVVSERVRKEIELISRESSTRVRRRREDISRLFSLVQEGQ